MLKGFCFVVPNVLDYFFVTDQTRRTEKLCERVEQELVADGCKRVFNGMYHGCFGDFSIHDMLDAAVCEVKHTEKFGDYYDIHGEGWGGRGSYVNDGKTKIIYL
jgi:hypothetical protein